MSYSINREQLVKTLIDRSEYRSLLEYLVSPRSILLDEKTWEDKIRKVYFLVSKDFPFLITELFPDQEDDFENLCSFIAISLMGKFFQTYHGERNRREVWEQLLLLLPEHKPHPNYLNSN